MIPIYSKLFNFIFDKGVVPVTWSVASYCIKRSTEVYEGKEQFLLC
jgi:hypothetical protein